MRLIDGNMFVLSDVSVEGGPKHQQTTVPAETTICNANLVINGKTTHAAARLANDFNDAILGSGE